MPLDFCRFVTRVCMYRCRGRGGGERNKLFCYLRKIKYLILMGRRTTPLKTSRFSAFRNLSVYTSEWYTVVIYDQTPPVTKAIFYHQILSITLSHSINKNINRHNLAAIRKTEMIGKAPTNILNYGMIILVRKLLEAY